MTQHIIDTDKLEKLIKGKIDLYDSQMEGADYDDFIRNEWAAGAMRQLIKELRTLIASSPQAHGMVLDEQWINAMESGEYDTVYKCPRCSNKYSVQAEDTRDELCCSCGFEGFLRNSVMLSAYKPQADDVRKDAWISVEDRLPDKNGYYLATDGSETYQTSFWLDSPHESGCHWSWAYEEYPETTHWQAFPAPPLDKARE